MSLSTQSFINAGLRLAEIATTDEFVSLASPHWGVEPFIPINTAELVDTLEERWDTWSESTDIPHDRLREVFSGFSDLLHHQYRPLFGRFAQRYAELDPDRDTRHVIRPMAPNGSPAQASPANGSTPAGSTKREQSSVADSAISRARMIDVQQIGNASRAVLIDAGYTEVERAELVRAVGVSSHWGVQLHVDFDAFETVAVYARGDVIGKRSKRRWQTFYREKIYDVSLYQRVVVVFKLREGFRTEDELDDKMLHMRLFKNIPKQDIDMLLPGTRVKFSWIDHLRNLVPSIGGIGLTIFKIIRVGLFVAAITFSMAAVLIGLLLALIGYLVRSVMNHLNAKNRYMLNLTRSLYYQKLDSNAGVAVRLLDEAETQRHREVVLAYYAILSAGEAISPRRLRRRVERMVREMIDLEVAFRDSDAVDRLETWGLIRRRDDGKLQTYPPEEAITRIAAYWDALFKP